MLLVGPVLYDKYYAGMCSCRGPVVHLAGQWMYVALDKPYIALIHHRQTCSPVTVGQTQAWCRIAWCSMLLIACPVLVRLCLQIGQLWQQLNQNTVLAARANHAYQWSGSCRAVPTRKSYQDLLDQEAKCKYTREKYSRAGNVLLARHNQMLIPQALCIRGYTSTFLFKRASEAWILAPVCVPSNCVLLRPICTDE